MKRVLCAWLPDFPIQRLRVEQPKTERTAAVLYAESGNRAQVVFSSREAQRHGIRAGMPLAEAQALHEAAVFLPYQPEADIQALTALAEICTRYSPLVGVERSRGADCLLLDISGCTHLFGGESGLSRLLVVELAEHGYFAHVAVADTIGAAWAIARHGHRAGADRRLRSLPVEALRISDRVAAQLREFDLHSIGQLAVLPRESLPARFGNSVVTRLDQLYGRCSESLTPVVRPDPVTVRWTADEPVCHRRAVESICAGLLEDVLEELRSRGEGLLELTLQFTGEDAEPVAFRIQLTRPSDSLPHLQTLLNLKLDGQEIPEWVHCVLMEATVTTVLQSRQHRLFVQRDEGSDENDVRQLVDRLTARLGTDAVVRPQLLPEAVPEQAVQHVPPGESVRESDGAAAPVFQAVRPLVLLTPPECIRVIRSGSNGPPVSFDWNRRHYRIVRCTAVERITTAWWQDSGRIHRDYFRVETRSGARFWLFQDQHHDWFLHGLFD